MGTFSPSEGGAADARGAIRRGEAVAVPAGDGAVALRPKSSTTSVYVYLPGVGVQIEVFSPKPGEAVRIVAAGDIVRVR